MINRKKTLVCLVGVSIFASAASHASDNPFKRPEVKVLTQPVVDGTDIKDDDIEESSPYDEDMFLEVPQEDIQPKETRDPRLLKASVEFRGSINGVDLYFDKEKSEYIYDKSALEKIKPLSAKLPELSKVNY